MIFNKFINYFRRTQIAFVTSFYIQWSQTIYGRIHNFLFTKTKKSIKYVADDHCTTIKLKDKLQMDKEGIHIVNSIIMDNISAMIKLNYITYKIEGLISHKGSNMLVCESNSVSTFLKKLKYSRTIHNEYLNFNVIKIFFVRQK